MEGLEGYIVIMRVYFSPPYEDCPPEAITDYLS